MKKLTLFLLIFACLGFQALIAQTVTGTVTSAEDGQTLPGVNVRLKNSNIGTITDGTGVYSINLPSLQETLVFSFVGLKTKEVAVDGRSVINVDLELSVLGIDDVVVVAYGTTTKASFTGSAQKVDSKKLSKIQATTITQALQGTASGVEVRNTTGQPGSNPSIRIRGISSINGSSDPLIVVDGAPFGGNINSINPDDVESMTVLKDAAATALYGARASGGVIVITTKTGTGAPMVEFKATAGVSDLATPIYPQVSNGDYYKLTWESWRNGYLDANPGASMEDAAKYASNNVLQRVRYNTFDRFPLLPDGSLDPAAQPLWETKWAEEVFRPGARQDYHLNLGGSTDDGTNYYFSLGFLQDKGTMTSADYKRYSGRLSVSKKVNNWFDAGLNASFNRGVQDAPAGVRQYRYSLDLSNIYPPWLYDDDTGDWATDADGNRIYDMGAGQYRGLQRATWVNTNPLAEADYSQQVNEMNDFNARTYVNITLLPGLTLKNNLAVDYSEYANYTYWHGLWSWANNQGGTSSRSRSTTLTYTMNNILNYSKSFGDHNIDILAGHEAYAMRFTGTSASAGTFPVYSLYELGAAAVLKSGWSGEDNHRIESYLSNAIYNFKDRYYLSASFRRDGTSRFHPDSRWGDFWSLGASWRLSEESFMKSVDWIDNLTLRASTGTQGNERIANYYAYLGLYSAGKQNNQPAFNLVSLTNPTLRWEKNQQSNIGFDLAMMNRFRISSEFFVRSSTDLLFNRELPMSAGLASIAENIGNVRNTGVEVQLYSLNVAGKNFRWETDVNLTSYKNVITSLPNEVIPAGIHRYEVGKSVYDFYLKDFAGVDQESGNSLYWKDTYELDAKGDPVLDENGDKIISGKETTLNYNLASYYYVGSALPKLFGNISNNFFFKNFDVSVNFVFRVGGMIYDNGLPRMNRSQNPGTAMHEDMVNRWTPENTDTDIPRLTSNGVIANMNLGQSTQYLVSGTYARMRNLTVGYTLPESFTRKIKLSSVRIFVMADNSLTIFKYHARGLDPELGYGGTTDVNTVTIPKTIIGGLQVRF